MLRVTEAAVLTPACAMPLHRRERGVLLSGVFNSN